MANQKGYLFLSGFSGVTHSDIANFTGKTLTTQENSVVDDLIASAEDFFARQCKRNFQTKDGINNQIYFEITNGDIDLFYPFNYPINEVTQIDVQGTTVYLKGGSNNQIILGKDFFVYPEKLELINKNFSFDTNEQAMTIYYSIDQFWGKDITLVIKRWISEIFLASQYGGKGISSINVAGGVNIQFDISNLPKYINDLITYYHKVNIAAEGGFKKGSQVGLHGKDSSLYGL
jgi:hypothetical protein